jgi:type II secretory pathway pseudopilin PulG
MKVRRGISLVELLAVIGAGAIIVGLLAGTIRSFALAERASQDHLREREVLAHLSNSFRRQVRAAISADALAEHREIKLLLPGDRSVSMQANSNQVTEIEHEAGRVVRQQSYRLATGSEPRFEIQSDAENIRVIMTLIRQAARDSDGPSREFRVEATLGRDRRFDMKEE